MGRFMQILNVGVASVLHRYFIGFLAVVTPQFAVADGIWSEFEVRCLEPYLNSSIAVTTGFVEVSPAQPSQKSFRSPDMRYLLILETAPPEGERGCLLYELGVTGEPAGKESYVSWRSRVLADGEFEADLTGRLVSNDTLGVYLRFDARRSQDVTLYEIVEFAPPDHEGS